MLFYNVQLNEDDGSYEFDMKATSEEVEFLMNLALDILITNGLVQLRDDTEEEQESDILGLRGETKH